MTEDSLRYDWAKRTNRRAFLKGSIGVAVGASAFGSALAACGSSETPSDSTSSAPAIKAEVDGDLELFSWSEYVAPDVIKAFEKEYGVKVKTSAFDSDEAMVQKVASGLPYDAIMTNSAYIPRMIEGDLLLALDHSQLANWDQIVPFFQDPSSYDPGAKYSIPYGYSPTGIGYRTDKAKDSDFAGSWSDLWNLPATYNGKIFVLDQVEEAMGASLLRLGYDNNSGDPEELKKAADELIKLKPKLAGFSTADRDNMVSGQASVTQAWSVDVYMAAVELKDASKVAFITPSEGALIGVDCLSIGKNAAHPGTAVLFLDWMLKPESSVACVDWMGQQDGTTQGEAHFLELAKDYPVLADVANARETAKWKMSPTGERQQLLTQEWTRVKAS
jgi:spermidine/putrescine transport system substrate-binding protein